MIEKNDSLQIGTKLFNLLPRYFDWVLFLSVVSLMAIGLITMNSFNVDESRNAFFYKQIWLVGAGISVIMVLSFFDFRILRKSSVVLGLYIAIIALLSLLAVVGATFKGAQSWFDLGAFSIQPSDPAKLALIFMMAKYFSRRHIEIANIKHILVSGLYAIILFILVLLQPDFGSAIIIFFIWLGMVLVAGISKKHLLLVFSAGLIAFIFLWSSVFAPYQKQRIMTFLNPLTDIHGAGYNAYQSTIAVGSGEVFGKGIGFGTQSKLQFLPEYQTDFIFAAFAEEWGFIGVLILFFLFGLVLWRIIIHAREAESNFESLFASGFAILILTHFFLHVGINIGLLPVTGTTIPFLSYGGSHLISESIGVGILMGMRKYSRAIHRSDLRKEVIGLN